MALVAGMILIFTGYVLFRQRKGVLKSIGTINIFIGLVTIIVDIFFLFNFFNNGIMKFGVHQFWEVMGVLAGIILLITGIIILQKTKKNSLKTIGWMNIILGILNIIVDSFFFLSWFIIDKIEFILEEGSNFLNMVLIEKTYIFVDNWSFLHFFWGMLIMFFILKYMKNTSYLAKSFTLIFLLSLYEVWEFIAIQQGILVMIRPLYTFESYMNIFWDIKIGILGGNIVFFSFKKNRKDFVKWIKKVFN